MAASLKSPTASSVVNKDSIVNIRVAKCRKHSKQRRNLLARLLNCAPSEISEQVNSRREQDEYKRLLYRINPTKYRQSRHGGRGRDERPRRDHRRDDGDDDIHSMYKDSTVFLKGTHSSNPHNDYSQHFVDTGQRPQNFIHDAGLEDRFEEYPKLKELIRLKDEQIAKYASPPMYLQCDMYDYNLSDLGQRFDVIYIDPPLEEYQRRVSGINFSQKPWGFEEIMSLKIEEVAAQRSFVFLWCGSCEGLDLGRQCFQKWGFRRCEDICWVKTNFSNPGNLKHVESRSVFQHTKEHCLMGIKGTVRRNQDGDFIHANVDLDIIITEEAEYGSVKKPEEIFHIMEHFCLGRRRLHLFGSDDTIRPGWLTLGPELSSSNYNKEKYTKFFTDHPVIPNTDEIETLRPKSPPPKGTGRGRGRGIGGSSSMTRTPGVGGGYM